MRIPDASSPEMSTPSRSSQRFLAADAAHDPQFGIDQTALLNERLNRRYFYATYIYLQLVCKCFCQKTFWWGNASCNSFLQWPPVMAVMALCHCSSHRPGLDVHGGSARFAHPQSTKSSVGALAQHRWLSTARISPSKPRALGNTSTKATW